MWMDRSAVDKERTSVILGTTWDLPFTLRPGDTAVGVW